VCLETLPKIKFLKRARRTKMKVRLTVKQRIDLQSILPAKGDFVTVKMLRVLREDLSFSQKEIEQLNLVKNPNGTVEWSIEAGDKCIKEVAIPETIINNVKETLERLNTAKQITDSHLDFYEMFMELPTTS